MENNDMKIEIPVSELRKKKVFVATPMYAGMCVGLYTKACIDLATIAAKYGMEIRFFFIFNESLITRARNYLADEFLRAEEFDYLMFIDSDISFNPNDVITLTALCDDEHPIIGGPYAKKCIAWEKVKDAYDVGMGDEDPNELEKFTGDYVFNPVEGTQHINVRQPVEVMEIGTGFMMIKRSMFKLFEKEYPEFKYRPDHNRSEHFQGDRYIHAFFDSIIDNKFFAGDKASKGTERYLSEDYMFCQWMRKVGQKVWLCPWMELGHVGTYIFNGSMQSLGRIDVSSDENRKRLAQMSEIRKERKSQTEAAQRVANATEVKEKKESRAERRAKERKLKKKLTKK